MKSRTTNKHLLVVDDDPVFRKVMQRNCEALGFNVMSCSSFRELETTAGGTAFDVVIMDYFLDNLKYALNGVEVAKVMEHVPIILVSTSDHCIDEYESWPVSIRAFYNKRIGAERIAQAACELTSPKVTREETRREHAGK